jgi:uncharacterized protein YciI
MQEFLYQLRPTDPGRLTADRTPEEIATLRRHVAYLEDLARQGVVVLAGRTQTTDERTFGLVIFRAASEGAAREVMSRDPAVADGLMRAELFPYRIAVRGPGVS